MLDIVYSRDNLQENLENVYSGDNLQKSLFLARIWKLFHRVPYFCVPVAELKY